MRRFLCAAIVLLFFSGCSGESREMDRALRLRDRILAAQSCSFQTQITADYGDSIETFAMDCIADASGDVTFSVTEPQSICGITGSITDSGGRLTFDEEALYFTLLTDELLSPVSAPWIFLRTLRSGYLTSAGMDGEYLRLTIHDSFQEDALVLDIWLDGEEKPVRSEILWDNRKILSLAVTNFTLA